METSIIAIADINYMGHLGVMVRSAAAHFPQATMRCHLINVPKAKREALMQSHPKIEITSERTSFAGWEQIRKYIYCANKRAELLLDAIKHNEYLLYLDADSIIRKPCDELVEILQSCDMTVKDKKKKGKAKPKYGRFSAGIIGFGNGPIAKQFIERYAYVVKNDINSYSDQYNLYATYKEFKDTIKYVPLPERFCDTRLSEDGVIWNGKSNRKQTPKYQKEMDKYAR